MRIAFGWDGIFEKFIIHHVSRVIIVSKNPLQIIKKNYEK
jgi:hypothetical protein